MIEKINAFMNGPTGPGHGHGNGMFYGMIILAATPLGLGAVTALCLLNHARVIYQELIAEGWMGKTKTGDFWYDVIFRPLTTTAMAMIGFVPVSLWPVWSLLVMVLGFQKKNEWPLLLFWKGK